MRDIVVGLQKTGMGNATQERYLYPAFGTLVPVPYFASKTKTGNAGTDAGAFAPTDKTVCPCLALHRSTMKPKLPCNTIASPNTGIAIPISGVSWNPPDEQRQLVKNVFTFMENRVPLYNTYALEMEALVSDSVLAIQQNLMTAIQELPEDACAIPWLGAMRDVCHEFLDTIQHNVPMNPTFFTAVGRLRALLGVYAAYLAVAYSVDIHPNLASLLPACFADEEQETKQEPHPPRSEKN